VVLLALGLAGCILSSTKVLTHSLGDLSIEGANFFVPATFVLSENATWREHRNDIARVDEVGVVTTVVNPTLVDASITLLVSEDPDLRNLRDLRDRAFPLFPEVRVPAGGRRAISYDESVDRLTSFDQVRTMVEDGTLTVYAVADGFFNLTLEDLTLVVTFTVER